MVEPISLNPTNRRRVKSIVSDFGEKFVGIGKHLIAVNPVLNLAYVGPHRIHVPNDNGPKPRLDANIGGGVRRINLCCCLKPRHQAFATKIVTRENS